MPSPHPCRYAPRLPLALSVVMPPTPSPGWAHHSLCSPHPPACQCFFTRADGNHWSILLPPKDQAELEGGASPSSRHTALCTMEISRFCWTLGSAFTSTSNFGGHMAMIPSSLPQHTILLGFQKHSQDCFPTSPFSWQQHRGEPGRLLLSRGLVGKQDARPHFSWASKVLTNDSHGSAWTPQLVKGKENALSLNPGLTTVLCIPVPCETGGWGLG